MFSPSNWPRYFLVDLGEDNDYALDNMLRKSVGSTNITYLPTNQRLIEVKTEEQSNILQGWVHSPPPDYKIAEHPELNSVTGTVAIPDGIHSGSIPFVDSAALIQENLADCPTPVLRVVTYILRDRTDSSRCTRIAKITFKGSDLPTHIRLAGRRLPVRQYVCRPRQCTKCWKFGHQTNNCRAAHSTCSDCGSTTHTAASCSSITISCVNCGGRHRPSSPRCSHFTYQQFILNFRLPRGLSHSAAVTLLRSEGTLPQISYASKARSTPSTAVSMTPSVSSSHSHRIVPTSSISTFSVPSSHHSILHPSSSTFTASPLPIQKSSYQTSSVLSLPTPISLSNSFSLLDNSTSTSAPSSQFSLSTLTTSSISSTPSSSFHFSPEEETQSPTQFPVFCKQTYRSFSRTFA